MCIRDRFLSTYLRRPIRSMRPVQPPQRQVRCELNSRLQDSYCLLYTSPSPRDGLLSIRRQASDVYKRQISINIPSKANSIDASSSTATAASPVRIEFSSTGFILSLIHISEPTRRTPLYSSASVRCV